MDKMKIKRHKHKKIFLNHKPFKRAMRYYKYILVLYTLLFWASLYPMSELMAHSVRELKCFDGNYSKLDCIESPYIWNTFMYVVLLFYVLHLLILNLLCLHYFLWREEEPPPLTVELTSISPTEPNLSPPLR